MKVTATLDDTTYEVDLTPFKRKGRGLNKILDLAVNEVKKQAGVMRISKAVYGQVYSEMWEQVMST